MQTTATHDPKALAVAQAMVSLIQPEDAFLFGSRARGDWTDASDIDVFTVAEENAQTRDRYRQALEAGKAKARQLYGYPVKVDLIRLNRQDFHHYRQAPSHIAHSALQEGIDMASERTGYGNHYPELEPNSWPDVEQRFTNYQRQALAAETLMEQGLGYEEVGQHMQRCLENSLKGFLVYMDYDDGQGNDWQKRHPISGLQEKVRTFQEGRDLLQDSDFSFLNEYAVDIPYQGVQDPLPDERSVLDSIKNTAAAIMDFIETDSGRQLPEYRPPGPR